MEYSYSFSDELQQEWRWPERYGTQPEILRYINHVADRFDLRRDIAFNTRVKEVVFDSKTSTWTIKTDNGNAATARFCIMATGNLSTPRTPSLPGLESFKGKWYHTGLWPRKGVDFTGLHVRCHRNRLFGCPIDTHHRKAGEASLRVPANRQFQLTGA
jgi:cyclohexanone monooxygenase